VGSAGIEQREQAMRRTLRATGLLIGLAGWGLLGAGMPTARAQVYYYHPARPTYASPRSYASPVRYYYNLPAAPAPRVVYRRVAPGWYPAYTYQPALPSYRYAVPPTWGTYRPASPVYGYRSYSPAVSSNSHWTDDTSTLIQDSL
jgi:hypothetical protein